MVRGKVKTIIKGLMVILIRINNPASKKPVVQVSIYTPGIKNSAIRTEIPPISIFTKKFGALLSLGMVSKGWLGIKTNIEKYLSNLEIRIQIFKIHGLYLFSIN